MYVKIILTNDFQIKVEEIFESDSGGRVFTGHDYNKTGECWIISDKIEAIQKLHEVQHKQFINFLEMINGMEIE